jgi:hypothetical protein
VARYPIPHARRIADAPLHVVPHISWGNSVLACVQGPLLWGFEGSFGGADPSQLSSPSSALVPRVVCDWSASRSPLRVEPLPEGHDPRDCFTMGSLWCLRKVISYLSLSICLSISSSLFNPHLGFTFGLYADLVRPQSDEEGVQGLRRLVRRSHGRGRQVDALLRGGCRETRTTGTLIFVLPRPALLDDDKAIAV